MSSSAPWTMPTLSWISLTLVRCSRTFVGPRSTLPPRWWPVRACRTPPTPWRWIAGPYIALMKTQVKGRKRGGGGGCWQDPRQEVQGGGVSVQDPTVRHPQASQYDLPAISSWPQVLFCACRQLWYYSYLPGMWTQYCLIIYSMHKKIFKDHYHSI